ncbi:MAG: filamentous hemagglutinin N-terminal domain-containing protein [Verrucomicrobia bacterium]|nr:filamentous hemagglutinin N-terminal domain-containing protein [Verrucomicrobiota bacterium]
MLKRNLFCSLVCLTGSLLSQPQDPNVVHGDVQLTPQGNALLEIRTGDKAIIEWKSFSIDRGEATRFVQPSASSAVLNRVTGPLRSEILGRLEASGKVFLINPHGVLIGKDGVIQTAGFLASTLDLPNDQFLGGENWNFQGAGEGAIIHLGTIASSQGDVILLGSRVVNEGRIKSNKDAVLGAGLEILIQPSGDRKLFVRPAPTPVSIDNTGYIEALKVEIESGSSAQSFAIRQTGRIDAVKMESIGGRIVLRAPQGKIEAEGTLVAQASTQIGAHSIHLFPKNVIESPKVSIDTISVANQQGTIVSDNVTISQKENTLFHTGRIEAQQIHLKAPSFYNAGILKADRGTIAIDIEGNSTETAFAQLLASEGSIVHHAGSYFSSGRYSVGSTNPRVKAGEIEVFAPSMNIVNAEYDASAPYYPGKIRLGKMAGDDQLPSHFFMSPQSRIKVKATTIEWSGTIEQAPQTVAPTSACRGVGATDTCVFDIIDEFIDPNPGSGSDFGKFVYVLPNGNVVILKPSNAGAAYLYNGATRALISGITGTVATDEIGVFGAVVLSNGNFVVSGTYWSGGFPMGLGAATWGDQNTGFIGGGGAVSSANSLVGSTSGDLVSLWGIYPLQVNGNYVVASADWTDPSGPTTAVGAATWCDGSIGRTGPVSTSNSLYGTLILDEISIGGVHALPNGNYVVVSTPWANGVPFNQNGAATWIDGATGKDTLGNGPGVAVSTSNSLYGSNTGDLTGDGGVLVLPNGHFVVSSPQWNGGNVNGMGAVTWCDGAAGTTVGPISMSNSLYGTNVGDRVSFGGLVGLNSPNDNKYVVRSELWNSSIGASTWIDGSTGLDTNGMGPGVAVSSSNSLVGSVAGDGVTSSGIYALQNGDYVVASNNWNMNFGAATLSNGTTGSTTGTVTTLNSLTGTMAGDSVSRNGVVSLSNGNYVVLSPFWTGGMVSGLGAATLINGMTGKDILGMGPGTTISSSNSLVGSTPGDLVGNSSATALPSGNYVVRSTLWQNAGVSVGAATWGNGVTGIAGPLTSSNSLIGSNTGDQIGSLIIGVLSNGNYVVRSLFWNGGTLNGQGAATWGNGLTGISGVVGATNSVVGSAAQDYVSNGILTETPNGCYALGSPRWSSDTGAVTPGSIISGATGVVSPLNSFVGTGPSASLSFDSMPYNSVTDRIIIPFFTENGSGRVFSAHLAHLFPPTPPTPGGPGGGGGGVVHVPSFGLEDMRLSLSETLQEWGPFIFGGIFDEDIYPPYLTYKEEELKEFPTLNVHAGEAQNSIFYRRRRSSNKQRVALVEKPHLEYRDGKVVKQ